jgi:ribosomal protein S18 acetylase RimI-like enzyme
VLQDPIGNVLVLGDLYSPLYRISDVYCALEGHKVAGVCSVYHGFSTPSVVFSRSTLETKQALLKKVLSHVSGEFISPCHHGDVGLFEKCSNVLHVHHEHQMAADPFAKIRSDSVEVVRVSRRELEPLSRFYEEHHAEAWAPIQFEAGPYYCIKHEGKIVSAAGVHVVAPKIAQLGNIVTDEAYRNQGFATACTSALAADLASKGRIISLFVRTGNAPAIHMYQNLGFSKKHEIAFLVMRKNA